MFRVCVGPLCPFNVAVLAVPHRKVLEQFNPGDNGLSDLCLWKCIGAGGFDVLVVWPWALRRPEQVCVPELRGWYILHADSQLCMHQVCCWDVFIYGSCAFEI